MDTISSQFTLNNLERKSHTFTLSFKPVLQYAYNYKSSVQPCIDYLRPVSGTYYNGNTLLLSAHLRPKVGSF